MKIFTVSSTYGQFVYAAESKEQLLEYLEKTNMDPSYIGDIQERSVTPGKVCFLGGYHE